jgi:all-trans-retinol dehydrogenase (NAD+)
LELKTVYNAPRVRLTMGIFCFIRTPLIGGETNVPNFLLPLLEVDSVGESLANAVYSGYGSTIYMPSFINRLAVTLVSSFGESLQS